MRGAARHLACVLTVVGLALTCCGSAGAYVYWTDNAGTTVGRANLDGTGVDPSFITGAGQPLGVAVDADQIYWSNHGTGTIGVANLDGSSPFQQLVTGGSGVSGVAVGGDYLYWSDYGSSTIVRANLDGSDADQSFITGVDGPVQIAVDGSYIYWASLTGTIGRADLDGTDVDQSFITGASAPYGVAVDGDSIYWSNFANGTIGEADLDGSDVDQSFITGATYPDGLAIYGPYLYWANHGDSTIGRAELDGSDVDEAFISGATNAYGLAVDGGTPPAPVAAPMAFGSPSTTGARLSLPASCSGSAGPVCTGTAVVTALERVRGRRPVGVAASVISRSPASAGEAAGSRPRTVAVTIAHVTYSLAAGETTTLQATLDPTGRRLLDDFYRVPAQLAVTGTGSLGSPVVFAYPRIHLTLAYQWATSGMRTLISQLTVGRIPPTARLELRCSGGGCRFSRHLLRHPRRQVALAGLFRRAALRPGAVVRLSVTAPGEVGDVISFVVRDGPLPRERVECLVPGARRPARCAG